MNRECLCRIRDIYRMASAFDQTLRKQFGLNINEAMLLCLVSDKKYISSGEIAEEMGLTHSNASKVISSLEKQKLICRHACKEDLRCRKFSIAEKGQELLAAINCDSVVLPEDFKSLI